MLAVTLKPRRCKHCREKFMPERFGQLIHSTCIEGYVSALRAKREAKQKAEQGKAKRLERVEFKARKEKAKPRGKWLAECQAIINKIVRLRDRHLPCCSCDLSPSWDGQWHASHFRSVGAASSLRFHLWNIHKSCSPCNNHKSGNIAEYRPRLVAKIGEDRVEWLMAQNGRAEYTIEYLKRFKAVMGKKLKRLEKRGAA